MKILKHKEEEKPELSPQKDFADLIYEKIAGQDTLERILEQRWRLEMQRRHNWWRDENTETR